MRRMYSQSQLETIVEGLIPETSNTHVYSLYKGVGIGTDTGSQTTIYFVSDKDITNVENLVAEDIYNKVIGVNYHEWASAANDDLWVSLSNFATDSNGKVNFYRIKERDGSYAGITDVNITLTTLKTYTLTKLV